MFGLSDTYITPNQATKLIPVNRLTIRRWVKEGKLRGEMVDRITLILKEDVVRLAESYGRK